MPKRAFDARRVECKRAQPRYEGGEMLTHTTAVEIGKPIDQVFEYAANEYFENHVKWDDGAGSTQ